MKRRISRRFRPTMTSSLDQLESRQLLTTGFQLVTSVSGLTPAAVAAISATDVVAVGSGTLANGDKGALIETFNGTTWSAATVPAESTGVLNGVAASSSSDVFAVGDTVSNGVSTPLVEFFNGKTWTAQATPTLTDGGVFNSVTVISPTDAWAVGNSNTNQLIEHFNGTSWSVVASPDAGDGGTLFSISAANANDIFAVGSVGKGEHPDPAALQFNGTTWSAVANGPTGTRLRRRDLRHRRLGGGRGGGYRRRLELQRHGLDRSLYLPRPGNGRLGLLEQRRLCRRRGGPGRAVERHELQRRLGHGHGRVHRGGDAQQRDRLRRRRQRHRGGDDQHPDHHDPHDHRPHLLGQARRHSAAR